MPRGLPEGPELTGHDGAGQLEGEPLTTEGALALASRPELARASIRVFHAACHTASYGGPGSTPFCMRQYGDEAIDTNYAPAALIAEGKTYREVRVRMIDDDGAPRLAIDSLTEYLTPTFAVSGPLSDLTVTMTPRGSLPSDLARVQGSMQLELRGQLTDRELLLTRTAGPTLARNTVQCSRAVLRASIAAE